MTLDSELEKHEEFVKRQRPIDYGLDIMFALGIGLTVNAIPSGPYYLGAAGIFTAAVGFACRSLSAYSKLYHHPDNSDIRERVESGERVSWMEIIKRGKSTT